MTEQEWLACKDPRAMLDFLRGKTSDRKLRLFAVACCRQDRDLLADPYNELAVDTSERFADGLASRRELKAVRRTAWEKLSDNDSKAAWEAAGVRAWEAAAATLWRLDLFRDDSTAIAVLRDIIGNPFRPAALDPAWLTWNDGVVRKLAQAAYDQRSLPSGHLDLARLAVLADALEEAGCTNAEALGHLRGPGPHVRGCWVVDLLLGKG